MNDVATLMAELESSRMERTQSLVDTAKFCRAICAFANDMPGSGLPGYLFIGVNKEGKPTGATVNERLLEALASHRNNESVASLQRIVS